MKKLFVFTFFITSSIYPLIAQQAYYNDVDLTLTGQDLYFELQNKIDQASATFTYEDARFSAEVTDEDTQNNSNILLVYGFNDADGNCTTDRSRNKNAFGGSGCEWNREHVFARSNANPSMGSASNATTGIAADPHNIRPSDQQMNNDKGNRLFAAGTGDAGVLGTGNWYPGDEWKGDVARMMMYMYTRYGDRCLPSLMGVGPLEGSTEMLQLFLQWNVEDPVSDFEDQRNPHLENVYGNRNPFIDNPYLATLIWGGPVAEDRWNLLSVSEGNVNTTTLYPNPASEVMYLYSATKNIKKVKVYNVSGQLITTYLNVEPNQAMDISKLAPGLYLFSINSEEESSYKKVIIQ